MLEYSNQDIVELLDACPNLNAAVKGFLKNDTGGDQQAAKFAKAFRKATNSARGIGDFVEKYHQDYAPHFLAIARHGHTEVINAIAEQVITQYADQFNETYEKNGDSITVKDQEAFVSITRDVCTLLTDVIAEAELPDNLFFRTIIIDWLYDPEVVPEVLPIFVDG
jgi:hypothetical protein